MLAALAASFWAADGCGGGGGAVGAGVWRGYLEALLAAPPVECMIELSWGNRFSGGSKGNPYIKREAKNFYNATVDPAAVARAMWPRPPNPLPAGAAPRPPPAGAPWCWARVQIRVIRGAPYPTV